MKLSEFKPGARVVIEKFEQGDALTLRMMEMGMTIGAELEVAYEAPFGGAIAVQCRGTLIALRLDEAAHIEVKEV